MEEHQQIALTLFSVSLFGALVNAFVIVFSGRVDSTHNSFVLMNVSQSFADCLVLLIFMAYAAPASYFEDWGVLRNGLLNHHVGQLIMVAYIACLYSHLAMSLNRFMAVTYPAKYKAHFTRCNTIKLIIATWILSLLEGIVFLFDDCWFQYSVEYHAFVYSNTRCGKIVRVSIDWVQFSAVIAVLTGVDVLTLYRIRKVFIQNLAFLASLILYMFLSPRAEGGWAMFCFTSLAWALLHTVDGIVTIVCNPNFRTVLNPRAATTQVQHLQLNHTRIAK